MSYVVRSRAVWGIVGAACLAGVAGLLFPAISRADVTHTVARGHTIEAIAHRYHVTAKSIVDANHLKDPKHLKIGETLTIPGVQPKEAKGKARKDGKDGKTPAYAMRAKTPGVIHATRLATSEDFKVRVSDRRGKQSPTALKTFEKMLRSAGGQSHPIDPRLIALVATVSDHFGSRKLEVISGFRPYSPTQYTPHSNHNVGHAIDFRVAGVPNEVLRDYCRTLKNVGVGYYPNSTFVHLDVRESPAFWIDYSKPGEAPRYNAANVDADEGTSDVADEPHLPAMSDPAKPAEPMQAPDPTQDPTPPVIAPQPAPAPSAAPAPAPSAAPAPAATNAPAEANAPAASAPSAAAGGGGSQMTSPANAPEMH